jgi:cation transporter-like permease
MILATAIVDTHALLELIVASLLAGVGVCVVYAVAVVGVTRAREHRRASRHRTATLYAALAVLALAACGWAIVTGITIMATK